MTSRGWKTPRTRATSRPSASTPPRRVPGSLSGLARQARGLFNLLDADDSGSISVKEFIQGCLRLRGQAKSIDVATLIYMTKRMASGRHSLRVSKRIPERGIVQWWRLACLFVVL